MKILENQHGAAVSQVRGEFEAVYRDSYGRMLTLALSIVRDRHLAEEAVQESYVQLWRSWASVERAAPWVRKAVVSRSLDIVRSSRRRNAILARYRWEEKSPAPSDSDFLELLHGLNEKQRCIVVLRYLEQLSDHEIAQILECPTGTVKSALSRALEKLRKSLVEERGHNNEC